MRSKSFFKKHAVILSLLGIIGVVGASWPLLRSFGATPPAQVQERTRLSERLNIVSLLEGEDRNRDYIEVSEQLTHGGGEHRVFSTTFSPKGDKVFFVRTEPNVQGELPTSHYGVYDVAAKKEYILPGTFSSADIGYRARWADDTTIVADYPARGTVTVQWMSFQGKVVDSMTLSDWDGNLFSLDYDTSGQYVAYITTENTVRIRARGERESWTLKKAQSGKYMNWVRWSPDGKNIIVFQDEAVVLLAVDVAGHTATERVLGKNTVYGRDSNFDPAGMMVWSPDSMRVVVQDSGNSIELSGAAHEHVLPTFAAQNGPTYDFGYRWSNDGTRLIAREGGRIVTLMPDGSQKEMVVNEETESFFLAGDRVLYTTERGVFFFSLGFDKRQELIRSVGKHGNGACSNDTMTCVYSTNGELWRLVFSR